MVVMIANVARWGEKGHPRRIKGRRQARGRRHRISAHTAVGQRVEAAKQSRCEQHGAEHDEGEADGERDPTHGANTAPHCAAVGTTAAFGGARVGIAGRGSARRHRCHFGVAAVAAKG